MRRLASPGSGVGLPGCAACRHGLSCPCRRSGSSPRLSPDPQSGIFEVLLPLLCPPHFCGESAFCTWRAVSQRLDRGPSLKDVPVPVTSTGASARAGHRVTCPWPARLPVRGLFTGTGGRVLMHQRFLSPDLLLGLFVSSLIIRFPLQYKKTHWRVQGVSLAVTKALRPGRCDAWK